MHLITKHLNKLKLIRFNEQRNIRLLSFVLVFAVIGTILLLTSFAATPYVSIEAEANAPIDIQGSDSTASGGKYVLFSAASSALRYEAESAQTNAQKISTGKDYASNKAVVGVFGSIGQYVTFSINVPSAGSYPVSIRYASAYSGTVNSGPDPLPRTMLVNNAGATTVNFARTTNVPDNWDSLTTKSLGNLTFANGANTLTFRIDANDGQYWDVDYLEVTDATVPATCPTGTTGTPPNCTPITAGKLPANLRIMTLGDSITQGVTNGVAYRSVLNSMLQGVPGHTYTFVGSMYDGIFNHEGHSGWCLNYSCSGNILPNIPDWINASTPNLVIMNGGVNDLVSGVPEPTVEQSAQSVVDSIFSSAPNAYIIIQPIAQEGGPTGDQIIYNNWMKNYVAAQQARGVKIYFADTSVVTTGMAGYHPVDAGYQQFGQIIFDVMRPLL